MRSILILAAMVALIIASDAPVTRTNAAAASPKCVAFCNNWCAKNFAMKNPDGLQRAVPNQALQMMMRRKR